MSHQNQPDPAPPPTKTGALFWLVSLCFFLSGMAGLIYQMVWMRYLSTVFGTSELAIVAVLVAYMGGLAAGAAVASKILHRLRRPIIAYAILELVVGGCALLSLPLLSHLHQVYAWLGVPDSSLGMTSSRVLISALVLLPPTVANRFPTA